MDITKYGHCCLLVEEKGLRILTDPGCYSRDFSELTEIDVILITHEHADHLHIPALQELLKKNQWARIYTTEFVKGLLDQEGIACKVLLAGQKVTEKGVVIEAIGEQHALIHSSIPVSTNVGFFINEQFFYPGDALTIPEKKVSLLALPVAGPWLKISEAIDYALAVKPSICFPVHEGILVQPGMVHRVPGLILEKQGIKWVVLEHGHSVELKK